MARQSAEAKAAAALRVGNGRRPEPPAELPEAAAVVWRGIVGARPVDWFAAGNLELLATYCRLVVVSRDLLAAVEAAPDDDTAVARMTKVAAGMLTIATKLRLTVQANINRKDRILDETRPEGGPTKLLGGHAVELRDLN